MAIAHFLSFAGAAVIRMLAGFLGQPIFRQGLTNYLNNKSEKHWLNFLIARVATNIRIVPQLGNTRTQSTMTFGKLWAINQLSMHLIYRLVSKQLWTVGPFKPATRSWLSGEITTLNPPSSLRCKNLINRISPFEQHILNPHSFHHNQGTILSAVVTKYNGFPALVDSANLYNRL